MLRGMARKPVLPSKGILSYWNDTLPREPVWPFPSILAPEASALRRQPIVQWTLAQAASRLELAIRPRHLIVQSKNFRDAFAQERPVVRPWREAADVHRPQIHCLLTRHHPFGEVFARPSRRSNTYRVEPGEEE